MGCAPSGESSRIESLRCESAMPAPSSAQAPSPSGPRWAIAPDILRARSSSSGRPTPDEPRSISPAMPHIGLLLFLSVGCQVEKRSQHDGQDLKLEPDRGAQVL